MSEKIVNLEAGNKKLSPGFNWRKLIRPETTTFIILILSIIICTQLSPYFADARFIFDSTSMYIEFGIVALMMTFIIISAQIDLSVASIMALVGCTTAVFFHAGASMGAAIVLGLLIGALCGAFNGLLVTKLQLPALIVTIGTMALYRGIAQILLGDHSLAKFPKWFNGIDTHYVGNTIIPVPLAIFLVLGVILAAVLNLTIFGRRIYAIGTNETAASYSAIPVNFLKMVLFTLSGIFAGVAGIMWISRLAVSRFDMAAGGELDAIIMVLLGGTDINGGKGNVFGTIIAFFIVVILRTGMSVAEIKPEKQLTVMGTLLILAIVIPNVINMFKSKRDA